MAEFKTEDFDLSAESIFSTPVETTNVLEEHISKELSGVAVSQNGTLSGSIPFDSEIIWQTFRLPVDFPRGVSGGDGIVVPKLSGFQVNLEIEDGLAPVAGIEWMIDYWHPTQGWIGVTKGISVGAPGDGNAWFNVDFGPIDIAKFWWRKFRFGIISHDGDPKQFRVLVPYNEETRQITVNNQNYDTLPDISAAPLLDGKTYPCELEEGKPAVLEVIGGDFYYSEQQGIEGAIYTSPNPYVDTNSVEYVSVNASAIDAANQEFEEIQDTIPFATVATDVDRVVTVSRTVGADIKAYQNDGVNPILDVGQEVSLRFRIFTTAPDVDTDYVGSTYRTVTSENRPENVRTSVGDLQDAYWLSAPNPSQFACESLYFDLRADDEAQVVDHFLIDPLTPGIFMNIYYSNDEKPGLTTDEWDGLLWQRVDKQYLLRRRENFALPEPITAKYLKLEFTQLQPVWYAPGTFQLPTQYRKHPKWVMDYYFSIYQHLRAQSLEQASTVNVSFDALELAYLYYLDDIRQDNPYAPETVQSAEGVSLLTNLLTKEQASDVSTVDVNTLLQIRTAMQPFLNQPSQQGKFGSLLQKLASQTTTSSNYPTEGVVAPTSRTNEVSVIDRDSLIVERQFPVTSFYLTSRHYYMISQATFREDRAYFAGIKEITFTRDHYASQYDNDLYIETAGDSLNIENSDFESVDHTWVTYTTVD